MRMKKTTTELVAEVLAGSGSQQSAPACGCNSTESVLATLQCQAAPGNPRQHTTTAPHNEQPTAGEEHRDKWRHPHRIPLDSAGCVDETLDRIFRGNLDSFKRLLDADKELVGVEPDDLERQRRAGIPNPARFKIITGLEPIDVDPPWVHGWVPTTDGSLKLMAPGPGGLPTSPKGLQAPKGPLSPVTKLKAPHLIPLIGPDDFKPLPSPPQSAQTSNYNLACVPIWHSGHHCRRVPLGLGMCNSNRTGRIGDAFSLAYQVIRCAEQEMAVFAALEEADRKYFWDSYQQRDLGAPQYWFGRSDSPRFEERFWTIFGKIQSWSMAFRHGFWDLETGVLFSCRSDKNKGGSTIARHFYLNIIELYDPWFKFPDRDAATALVILHEMAHKSDWNINFWGWFINSWGGAYAIKDSLPLGELGDQESSVNCSLGNSDKCYLNQQNTGVVLLENIPHPFNGQTMGTEDWIWIDPFNAVAPRMGIEPRALAVYYDGTGLGYSDLVYNQDNYVSWMWNRWLDHGYATLAPPGTPPTPC
jgi:hypothetical protein